MANEAVPKEEVRALVAEVLRVGLALTDLLASLIEALPDHAFPGRDPAEVLIEMVTGTLGPVADSAGADSVREATALTGAILDRVLSDLRLAASLARE
jgi:hypothetical protein